MSEKLGKTHYDIRILHEFMHKAPIKLNELLLYLSISINIVIYENGEEKKQIKQK